MKLTQAVADKIREKMLDLKSVEAVTTVRTDIMGPYITAANVHYRPRQTRFGINVQVEIRKVLDKNNIEVRLATGNKHVKSIRENWFASEE